MRPGFMNRGAKRGRGRGHKQIQQKIIEQTQIKGIAPVFSISCPYSEIEVPKPQIQKLSEFEQTVTNSSFQFANRSQLNNALPLPQMIQIQGPGQSFSFPDSCSSLLEQSLKLLNLIDQTYDKLKDKVQNIQKYCQKLLCSLDNRSKADLYSLTNETLSMQDYDMHINSQRQFKTKHQNIITTLNNQILCAHQSLESILALNEDQEMNDSFINEAQICQIIKLQGIELGRNYSKTHIGILQDGLIALKTVDNTITDIVKFSIDDNGQCNYGVVKNFDKGVSLAMQHDDRIIIDMDCFKYNVDEKTFNLICTLDYKDMVSGCSLTTLKMLISQSIYGKIALFEWDQSQNLYTMVQRVNLSHHLEFILGKMQPNFYTDENTYEVYTATSHDCLKRFSLKISNLRDSKPHKVHNRRNFQLIEYRQQTPDRMLILYNYALCLINPITREELGYINLTIEQTSLIFAPGFDIELNPLVLLKGQNGIELASIHKQADTRRKNQLLAVICDTIDTIPIVEMSQFGQYNSQSFYLCERDGRLCSVGIQIKS